MAYTALQLITRAYYLSQVVSRDLETPTGGQIEDGLYLLNAFLDFKGTDIRQIPYYQELIFNSIQGQEMYFIPNLLDVDSLTFNIGPVRFPMSNLTRKEYWSGPRVDDIQSLPFSYRIERCFGGTNIYLYFLPASNYVMKLWGKFGLTDVTLTTDLSLIYDTFYIEYLRYSLSEYICCEWGTTFPDGCQRKLDQMVKKLMDVEPKDLRCNKQSYFTDHTGAIDWQVVNLYRGWLPG
jgi:hypothetical protein